MSSTLRLLVVAVGLWPAVAVMARGEEARPYTGPACGRAVDDYFAREVWPKVGAARCVQCHQQGGDAEGTRLVLKDPRKEQGLHAREEALRHNRDAFYRLAHVKAGEESRLLVKVAGGLRHGGGDVLKPDTKGYAVLAEFVRRSTTPRGGPAGPVVAGKDLPPFFEGVVMVEPGPAAAAGDVVAGRSAAHGGGEVGRGGEGARSAAAGARRVDEGGGVL